MPPLATIEGLPLKARQDERDSRALRAPRFRLNLCCYRGENWDFSRCPKGVEIKMLLWGHETLYRSSTMTQSTISDDRLDRIEQKLDHLSTTVDTLSTTVDTLSTTVGTLSTTVDKLSADNEKFNDRFSNYQQATQWVVQLAFTLIASATITVIITSVLRK